MTTQEAKPKLSPQHTAILNHLRSGGSLTVAQALTNYGIYALSQRVGELKRDGYNINSRTVTSGKKHFSEYFIGPWARASKPQCSNQEDCRKGE